MKQQNDTNSTTATNNDNKKINSNRSNDSTPSLIGTDGNRNCWRNARERNRMKARYSIRQRIQNCGDIRGGIVGEADGTNTTKNHDVTVNAKRNPSVVAKVGTVQQQQQQLFTVVALPSSEDSSDECMNGNMANPQHIESEDFEQTIDPKIKIQQRQHYHDSNEHEKVLDDNICKNNRGQHVMNVRSLVQDIIVRIVEGDRSYFSLQFMEKNFILLSNPLPTEYLWIQSKQQQTSSSSVNDEKIGNNSNNELVGESRLLSWYLHDTLGDFKKFISNMESFTFMEYSIWIQRYYITSQLLLGGINPCIRGAINHPRFNEIISPINHHYPLENGGSGIHNNTAVFQDTCNNHNTNHNDDDLTTVGYTVMKRFFSGVPVSLSTYIIKRVVEMRMEIIYQCKNDDDDDDDCTELFSCSICHQPDVLRNRVLRYVNDSCTTSIPVFRKQRQQEDHDSNQRTCQHIFCEPCFWNDLLQHIDSRQNDVVVCPVCCSDRENVRLDGDDNENVTGIKNNRNGFNNIAARDGENDIDDFDSNALAICRAKDSLTKYLALPKNSQELKLLKTKKSKISERKDYLSSTWVHAIKSLVGSCQTVRLDKFFSFIETPTKIQKDGQSEITLFHYIKGCLTEGIDIHMQNEYGQTVLFIACWHGYTRIVHLLLSYGADASIQANGCLTCADVARFGGYLEIVDHIQHYRLSLDSDDNTSLNTIDSLNDLISNRIRITMTTVTKKPTDYRATEVIDRFASHPGAGSFVIDNVLTFQEVESIIDLWKQIPQAKDGEIKKKGGKCSIRSYFCDCEGWITKHVERAAKKVILLDHCTTGTTQDDAVSEKGIGQSTEDDCIAVFPHVRFLAYTEHGTTLAPHVDLCRLHPWTGQRSTHSFLLYLTDCAIGGETVLLGSLSGDERQNYLSVIQPKCGRLLIFPHQCPHEGLSVQDVPKILIRGELRIPSPICRSRNQVAF